MSQKKVFIPRRLKTIAAEALLSFYDNPRNFTVDDCRVKNYHKAFPKNVLILLTHGNYKMKSENTGFASRLNEEDFRLIKNFSDFGTKKVIRASKIPHTSIIENKGARIFGDANRHLDADDFIRENDFSGNKLSVNPEEFREEGKAFHKDYHDRIRSKMKDIEATEGGVIGFDIHDTGIRMMNEDHKYDKFREEGFPFITLGTRDGQSCNDDILDYFAERIKYYLGIKCYKNEPCKGGYVTTHHGEEYRKTHNSRKRNMIQIEIGRFLYIKESTQRVDYERMHIIGEGLKRAITDTGIKFGKDYFDNLD